MTKIFGAFLFLALFAGTASAQFRTDVDRTTEAPSNTLQAMTGGGGILGELFNPERWSMHQSYSMSYSMMGNESVGLSMFTNTISYKASENMFVSADVSAVYSPFNTLGSSFSKQINGVYLSSARLDWKLGDNTFMRVEYVGGPSSQYSPFGGSSYYNSPFSNSNGWKSTSATFTH